jgi:hypothetical protein
VSKGIYKKSKNQKRRTPGGKEEFLFEKSFGSESSKISEVQRVHGKSKSLKYQAQEGKHFHKC